MTKLYSQHVLNLINDLKWESYETSSRAPHWLFGDLVIYGDVESKRPEINSEYFLLTFSRSIFSKTIKPRLFRFIDRKRETSHELPLNERIEIKIDDAVFVDLIPMIKRTIDERHDSALIEHENELESFQQWP